MESKETRAPELCDLDKKNNYITTVLRCGLLSELRQDSVREGDGQRMVDHWKYDFMTFFAHNHTNYSIICFEMIANINALLSPKNAFQLIHNRFVNHHGGQGHNVAGDQALEFLNKVTKPKLQRVVSITEKVTNRVGKSIRYCQDVSNAMDREIGNFSSIGRHAENNYEADVEAFVADMKGEDFFTKIPGRAFPSFPNIKAHEVQRIPPLKVHSWLCKQKVRIHDTQISKGVASRMES